jgi:hypothetical protein
MQDLLVHHALNGVVDGEFEQDIEERSNCGERVEVEAVIENVTARQILRNFSVLYLIVFNKSDLLFCLSTCN